MPIGWITIFSQALYPVKESYDGTACDRFVPIEVNDAHNAASLENVACLMDCTARIPCHGLFSLCQWYNSTWWPYVLHRCKGQIQPDSNPVESQFKSIIMQFFEGWDGCQQGAVFPMQVGFEQKQLAGIFHASAAHSWRGEG